MMLSSLCGNTCNSQIKCVLDRPITDNQQRILHLAPPNLLQFAIENSNDEFAKPYDLAILLNAIGSAGKFISSEINRAALRDIFGSVGAANVTGDDQQKLDVIGDNVVAHALLSTGIVCAMSSEENAGLIDCGDAAVNGEYVVVYDPVDGSSNIDVAAPIGTIFGIYRRLSQGVPTGDVDILRPGNEMLAAGYVLYGSSTIFCYTSGHGVQFFTLDPTLGDYILTDKNVRSHGSSHVYSANEGNSGKWNDADIKWASYVKSKGYSGRYIGALVADFHRNLTKGGIYAYPGDKSNPSGKLRLLFECAPLAFVAEQAGGAASDGNNPIRNLTPKQLHHRTPMYIGNADEVQILESFHRA